MSKLRKELYEARKELDLLEEVRCDKEEDKIYQRYLEEGKELPNHIYENSEIKGSFMKVIYTDLSPDEIEELMLYRQTIHLQKIRGSVTFLAVIIGIPAVIVFLMFFGSAFN